MHVLELLIFDYLNKNIDGFFQACANNIWGMRGLEASPLLVLITLHKQQDLITLQKM
jgi:hypothetical protein